MYVRIRNPKNKNEDIPQSITTSGVKIVRGGKGTLVTDKGKLNRIEKIYGNVIETSDKPFDFVPDGPRPDAVIQPPDETPAKKGK